MIFILIKKNKQFWFFYGFLLFVAFVSCSKSPKCWGEDKNKGIIEGSINLHCLIDTNFIDGVIIENDSVYKTLFTDKLTGKLNCSLPSIDFNKYSLLGLYATGQCKTKFIREVTEIPNEKKYHFKVTIKNCGICKSQAVSYNWVKVPKIPKDWTITFETEKK